MFVMYHLIYGDSVYLTQNSLDNVSQDKQCGINIQNLYQ